MPVHHRHRRSRAEAAKVGPRFRALLELLVVGSVEFGGRRLGVHTDLEGLVEDDVAEV